MKELVSGVPDLQGDMDINLDAVPTTTNEQLSGTTPSPSTTSSLTWPNNHSPGVASNTDMKIQISSISATSAVATSSSSQAPASSSSVPISTTSISQQFAKSSFKNSSKVNKNNNTSNSRSGSLQVQMRGSSCQNDTNHKHRDTPNNPLEPKESLNTKVVRKR